MNFLVTSSSDDDRHNPIVLPRNAQDNCVGGCSFTISPSTAHPAIRSKAPTQVHKQKTPQPSRTPIIQRTFQPTVKSPTEAPSASPSTSTAHPTIRSKVPTQAHIPKTSQPSRASTIPGTFQPTVKTNCKSQSDGTFGTFSAGSATSLSIQYNYRLETLPSTKEFITSQVLPPLERQLVDKLIPSFFADTCGRTRFRATFALANKVLNNDVDHKRLLQSVVGISSSPADMIQETCTPTLNTNDTCVIVNGRLTIYAINVSSATNASTFQDQTHQTICKFMSNGELLHSQDSILSLKCVHSNYTKIITDGEIINPSQTTVRSGAHFYNYIIGAAAFGIVLVVLFVFIRRKIAQKKTKDQVEPSGVVEDNEAKNLDSSDAEYLIDVNIVDDDLGTVSQSDAHNLLLTGDDFGGSAGPAFSDNEDICPSPDSLEALENSSIVDTYDFAPVLSSISSPSVLASFAKSSYFPSQNEEINSSLSKRDV